MYAIPDIDLVDEPLDDEGYDDYDYWYDDYEEYMDDRYEE